MLQSQNNDLQHVARLERSTYPQNHKKTKWTINSQTPLSEELPYCVVIFEPQSVPSPKVAATLTLTLK
jgi:hypothetical protein